MSQTLTVKLLADLIDQLLQKNGAIGRGAVRELRDHLWEVDRLQNAAPPELATTQAQIPASPVAEGRKNGAPAQ